MRLTGKTALITGAGSGVGAAGAATFAREGANVVAVDVDPEGGEATVASITGAGGSAIFVAADVTDEGQLTAAVDRATEAFGGLDIVWANAGLIQPLTPIEEIDVSAFHRMMDVNVLGPWLTVRQALPALRASARAAVVITASLSGLKARPQLSAYQASKGASVMLTQSLAAELAPDAIRVNAVCPVAIETPMLDVLFAGVAGGEAEAREGFARAVPLGRLATAQDVADAALFLASDEAGFVTGVALRVDGGAGA